MTLAVSVVIPAFNPRLDYLQAALKALESQTLDLTSWEVVVVDNRSEPSLQGAVDLDWHPAAAVIREERQGLTRARLAGLQSSEGEIVVLVDDDNVLQPDYLERALEVSKQHPTIGVWGGGVAARFERPELAPPLSLYPLLALRHVAADLWSNDINHHTSTPWGAGLCVRREVCEQYACELERRPLGLELDLQGDRLVYGGDTDIAYTGCAMGLGKGVFKALQVEHLIPAARCHEAYLCRVAEGRGYSEVLHHLVRTGRLPGVDRSPLARLRQWRGTRLGSPIERRAARARLVGMERAMRELGKRS